MAPATEKIRILVASANPSGVTSLKLDEEVRQIESRIHAGPHGGQIELISKWANRPLDLLDHLNRYEPHVVHFSGHGSPTDEILLVDEQGRPKPVPKEALVSLFRVLKKNIRLVLLNACYSRPQALAITSEIDCAIGMKRAVGDEAAIIFASQFYSALSFGRPIGEAFEQARTALLLQGISDEHRTPIMLTRKGVTPDSLRLVNPS